MHIDLSFPVRGDSLPADHAYLLYAALSRRDAAFHALDAPLRFAPISGEPGGRGELRLTQYSRLRFRLPSEQIAAVLPLAGQPLDVAGHTIRLGVPSVQALVPAPALQARIVTFKHGDEPERFLQTAQQKLGELNVAGQPAIPLFESGPRAGEPRRRVVRIHDKRVIGYALLVEGLTAAESIRLQESGLGGRSRMGCGFFLQVRPRA